MGKAVIVILVLLALLGVVLFTGRKANAPGTQSGETPGGVHDNTGGKPAFKVALITPGPVSEAGWSRTAYEGLLKIQKDLGAEISKDVAPTASDAFTAFRTYADKDMQLIIGHASEWFDPQTIQIAQQHPKTVFLITGAEKAEKNVVGMRLVLEDGAYVLGQIAGGMTKTGKLGCIGWNNIPVIESTFYAFEEGAKSVRKDVEISVKWTQGDVARSKEQTLTLIGQGFDFFFHNANEGARGVFEAVQEKRRQGAEVYAFGSNADQNADAPDAILASAVLDVPSAFATAARRVKEGKFEPSVQYLGMPDGLVWIVYNKQLESKIPPDVRKNADATAEKIKKREFIAPRKDAK